MTASTTYCTILARNYLPKALALADSVRRHHGSELVVLLIDVLHEEDLPQLEGVRCASTELLGLTDREVLDLAASYGLVEFATAIKPPLLRALLEDTDQVVYLDPDTYVTSPMVELDVALRESESGIVLTPHYLEPIPEGAEHSEGHLLTVGVFNLGFCAVDRRSRPFLDWWWDHLKEECLYDLLSGLFVDQKWVDIGATLFHASPLRHYGYNVGVVNLHERPIDVDAEGWFIRTNGDRLRLFHFHSFDPHQPEELTTRFDTSSAHLRQANASLDVLCKEYAELVVRAEQSLPPAPAYVYAADTAGRRVSRQARRAFRRHRRQHGQAPSPFLAEEAGEWSRWRRRARKQMAKDLVGDAGKAIRIALPDEFARVKKRFPGITNRLKSRYADDSGIWK